MTNRKNYLIVTNTLRDRLQIIALLAFSIVRQYIVSAVIGLSRKCVGVSFAQKHETGTDGFTRQWSLALSDNLETVP